MKKRTLSAFETPEVNPQSFFKPKNKSAQAGFPTSWARNRVKGPLSRMHTKTSFAASVKTCGRRM